MQNNGILVSIICTAFNHENLIRSALDGFVMQQTDFEYEVLVHDDASTDATAQVIREYAEKYPHRIVPVLQTENQYSKGVRITNDILIPMAKGKYLAFCEGDDFWTDAHKLQRQVDFLESHPGYVACVHNTVVHDCTGKTPDCLHVAQNEEHDLTFGQVIRGMSFAYHTSSLMMRRDMDSNLPDFYNVAVSYGFGDWPRAIWLCLNGKVRFLSGAMSTYRLMSNPHAWSTKDFGVKRRIHNLEGNVAMLETLKKHLSPDQVAQVEEIITDRKFHILMLQERFDELKQPPYDGIWNKMSMVQKTKIWVKKNFRGL